MRDKATKLFVVLGGFFVANALLAELIGGKIFSLEASLGFDPLDLTLFGQGGLGFNLTAGVLLWPVVFIMTDIINEYFGRRGVRFLSFLTVGLILYAFLMLSLAMEAAPAQFWLAIYAKDALDIDAAFRAVLGQSLWIIAGSMVAFLIGQFVDVAVFQLLRRQTQSRMLWLRATGSTLVSQLIDSFVVLFIAFYIGPQQWSMTQVLAVGAMNYAYKFAIAVALTPLLYIFHWGIDRYLGEELAQKLTREAEMQR